MKFTGSLFVALLSMSVVSPASAGTYQEAFDRFDGLLNGGQGYSNSSNLNATLAWGESYIMMGYMAMFRATEDPQYLRQLIDHAENVILQRDDSTGQTDYLGRSEAAWSCTKYTDNEELGLEA